MKPSTPIPDSPAQSQFILGCALWCTFCLLAVFIRGVRWDEDYEFAQAMTGLVPYDDGHPLRQYTLAAYNLQFYASALLLKFTDSPLLFNGLRNLLFNLATVLPAFMLGTWLSRRAWIGHVAVVFILMGIHLQFDGVYPQFIWPGMFSNGHIGTGYALLFAGCLAARHHRIAGLLLGLMPMIHLGQFPPAGLLALLYTLHCYRNADRIPIKNAVIGFITGIVCCAIFYLIQQQSALPLVTDGPYFAQGDISAIWQGRMASGRDMHRSLPTGNIHLIAFATVLIALLGWFRLRNHDARIASPWSWLSVYALSIIGLVYSIALIHFLLQRADADIPYLLLGWLPYRLLNNLAPILLVMCLTLIANATAQSPKRPNRLVYLIPALLVFQLAKPLYPFITGEALYFRYLWHNDSLCFILVGAASGALAYHSENDRPISVPSAVAIFVATGLLALTHQFGAACFLLGGLLTLVLQTRNADWSSMKKAIPVYTLSALVLLALMVDECRNREHLPIGDFEQQLTRILNDEGKPNALIAARPDQVLLQAQTGHPIFTDMATEFHASYRPALGPSIQQMYSDVYGITFMPTSRPAQSWQSIWTTRFTSEWTALRDKYGIEFLVTPNDVRPQLPLVFEGDLDSLYRIPE